MITGETLASIFRILSALAFVMGLIFFTLFALKRISGTSTAQKGRPRLIRTIATLPISPKKYISLVDVAGEIIVLGITAQQISMLCKVEGEDSIEMIRSQLAFHKASQSFRGHLESLLSNVSFLRRRSNEVSDQVEK